MDEQTINLLIKKADEARRFAYAPYSRFMVGAAFLMKDGEIITGVNVENASYPVGICAERNALAHIVSRGQQGLIVALAVVTDSSPPGSPCGFCRQFLNEFLDKNTPIILSNNGREITVTSLAELLPMAFDRTSLTKG